LFIESSGKCLAARARPWALYDESPGAIGALVDESTALRAATVALFRSLPDEAWTRGGIASDKQVSVRALAYMVAGHVIHHVKVLRDRYAV
jgi:hypothetical protein